MLESVGLWRRALGFHLRHLPQLLAILPLLVVPVLGDALHSVLIAQERETGEINVWRAVREAVRITRPLAAMKLVFEGAAIAWAVIPIYGVVQGMRHRLYWAMASNVVVFERVTGEAGRARCHAIANGDGLGLALWTLVKLPGDMRRDRVHALDGGDDPTGPRVCRRAAAFGRRRPLGRRPRFCCREHIPLSRYRIGFRLLINTDVTAFPKVLRPVPTGGESEPAE